MQKFISCPGFAILRICYNSSIFHLTFPSRWPIYITMLTMTITNTLASPFMEEIRLGQDAHAIVPYSRAISKLRRPVVVSNFVGRQGGGTASVRPLLANPSGRSARFRLFHPAIAPPRAGRRLLRTVSSGRPFCAVTPSSLPGARPGFCLATVTLPSFRTARPGLLPSMTMPSRQPGGLRPGPRTAPAEAAADETCSLRTEHDGNWQPRILPTRQR